MTNQLGPYEEITLLRKNKRELEAFIAHTAQTVHQAHHPKKIPTWQSCPMDICSSSVSVLGITVQLARTDD